MSYEEHKEGEVSDRPDWFVAFQGQERANWGMVKNEMLVVAPDPTRVPLTVLHDLCSHGTAVAPRQMRRGAMVGRRSVKRLI